jgi:DNA-binding NarL/FixJ family response regulator
MPASDGVRLPCAETLTPREVEVLELICMGHSTREVAVKLGISFKTASTHRYSILSKTSVRNSVQLLLWAIKRGLVAVELSD